MYLPHALLGLLGLNSMTAISFLGIARRQKSAPNSVEARSGAAALARELGKQG